MAQVVIDLEVGEAVRPVLQELEGDLCVNMRNAVSIVADRATESGSETIGKLGSSMMEITENLIKVLGELQEIIAEYCKKVDLVSEGVGNA